MFSDLQLKLQICCAVYRDNGGFTHSNNIHELFIQVEYNLFPNIAPESFIPSIVLPEDVTLTDEIISFIKKYSSIDILEFTNDDEDEPRQKYLKAIFSIIDKNKLTRQDIRKLAKLPDFFIKYKAFKEIKRKTKFADSKPLGNVGEVIHNMKCEVVHVIKTKHYEGYNVTGIINDTLVTWYSPYTLSLGYYNITQATIKSQDFSYYANREATRLGTVKGSKIKNEN